MFVASRPRSLALGLVAVSLTLAACDSSDPSLSEAELDERKAMLGKLIYYDTGLSEPAGQACASCHAPENGYAEPHQNLPVSQGADPNLVGNRNAPSSAYAMYSPPFHFDADEGHYVGGQFLDGRAADLVEQAKGPFLNPVEMGNADAAMVVDKVRVAAYAGLFEEVYGGGSLDEVDAAYGHVADALAAYEHSAEINRFSSKFDAHRRGEVELTAAEQRGLMLFNDPAKGNCSACHTHQAMGGEAPLFTDFTYDNIGIPSNPDNPFLQMSAEYNPDGVDFVDLGLGGVLGEAAENGKFKVPTLRNIALTAPYGHNGYFQTLEEIVRFYATRDTDPAWPAPEVAENLNTEETGTLPLSEQDILDIVAFLNTLTDGWSPATGTWSAPTSP